MAVSLLYLPDKSGATSKMDSLAGHTVRRDNLETLKSLEPHGELAMAKKAAKAMTKTEILNTLAEGSGLSRKEVSAVLDGMETLIADQVGKKGPGVFNLPGLFKITVTHKPATKARKGINPFTKEETMFKAKPARNVVKVRPLKKLKDMV
jgi:nucleoid DNA-binding protein